MSDRPTTANAARYAGDVEFRVVAVRGGVPLAHSWKFVARGDEFYAAARHSFAARFSFHSPVNWRFKIAGGPMRPLFAQRKMDGWRHVLLVGFLIAPDALRPTEEQHPKTTALEIPEGHKARLDVIVSIDPVRDDEVVTVPILEPKAIGSLRLRSDRLVLFLQRIEPLTTSDLSMIDQVRGTATVTLSGRGPHYGEIAAVHSSDYNAVTVVPLAAGNFVDQ
jgi:hypothetical protein